MDSHYLGLDCSSKAIHGVMIDDLANLCFFDKWASKLPDFEARFPLFLKSFYDELGIIKERFPTLRVAIEAPFLFRIPKQQCR